MSRERAGRGNRPRRPPIGEDGRQLAHDRVHEAGLGRAGHLLRPLDGVVHDPRPLPLVRGAFQELEAGDKEDRPGDKAGRMGDETRERRFDPPEMPHDAEDKVLAAAPFGAREPRRQALHEEVDPLPPVQPAGDQPGGGLPGTLETRFDNLGHSPFYSPVHALTCATMNSEAVSALLTKNPALKAFKAKLEAMKPGAYVVHRSWGFGQIKSYDDTTHRLVIDFKGKKAHTMDPVFCVGDDGGPARQTTSWCARRRSRRRSRS